MTAIKIPVYSDWGQKTPQIGGGLGLVMEQQQLAVSCHTNYADHSTLTSPCSRGGYIPTKPDIEVGRTVFGKNVLFPIQFLMWKQFSKYH